jgi:hypothetical protein
VAVWSRVIQVRKEVTLNQGRSWVQEGWKNQTRKLVEPLCLWLSIIVRSSVFECLGDDLPSQAFLVVPLSIKTSA